MPYSLTADELSVLTAQLGIAVRTQALLADWIGALPQPQGEAAASAAQQKLVQNGMLSEVSGRFIAPADLTEIIQIANGLASQARVFTRAGEVSQEYHFGFLKSRAFQYEINQAEITLSPPDDVKRYVAEWFPAQIQVSHPGMAAQTLSLGGLLLLFAACETSALTQVRDLRIDFSKTDLQDAYSRAMGSGGRLRSMGIPFDLFSQVDPVEADLEDLIQGGLLQKTAGDRLALAEFGGEVFEMLRDARMRIVTLSVKAYGKQSFTTGSLYFGNGRLMLVEYASDGQVRLKRLPSRDAAEKWMAQFLGAADSPAQAPETPISPVQMDAGQAPVRMADAMGAEFELLKSRYDRLAEQRRTNAISQEEFENDVNQLRLMSTDGSWWQIGVQAGEWYHWVNNEWRKETPPYLQDQPKVIKPPVIPPAKTPTSGAGKPAASVKAAPAKKTPWLVIILVIVGLVILCCGAAIAIFVASGVFEESSSSSDQIVPALEEAVQNPLDPQEDPLPALEDLGLEDYGLLTEQQIADSLLIKEVVLTQDAYGSWVLSGILENISDRTISGITCHFRVFSASGDVIYEGDTYALMSMLPPNQTSSLSQYISELGEVPDYVDVAVTEAYGYGKTNLRYLAFQVSDLRPRVMEDGSVSLLATLSNTETDSLRVTGMTAAVYDAADSLLLTNSYSYPEGAAYFESGDSFPIEVNFGSVSSDLIAEVDHFELTVWGEVVDETPLGALKFLDGVRSFYDQNDSLHVIGQFENQSDMVVSPEMIGMLYDESGAVLQVARQSVSPSLIMPGQVVSFDVSYWPIYYSDPTAGEQVTDWEVNLLPSFWPYSADDYRFEELIVKNFTYEDDTYGSLIVKAQVDVNVSEFDSVYVTANVWNADRSMLVGTMTYGVYDDNSAEVEMYLNPDPDLYDPNTIVVECIAFGYKYLAE